MNAQCPIKRWSTLKSAVFGSTSNLHLTGVHGGLVYELLSKADLWSDHFDSKQSRDPNLGSGEV